MEISAVLMLQIKRVLVVEEGEFIFAEGHELTVQRFYIYRPRRPKSDR